jgi:ankyrin repeat protein
LQGEQRGKLIATGDPDKRDEGGWTPLHHAIRSDDIEEVQRLLLRHANPGLATPDGLTPLLRAMTTGHYGIIQSLLDTGRAECNATDRKGCTALHHAAIAGDLIGITMLLEAGSAPHLSTSRGFNVLHCAAMFDHADAVALLMERSAGQLNVPSQTGWAALHLAAFHGYPAVAAALVSRTGVDVNERIAGNSTALHIAAINGKVAVIRVLLAAPHIEINALRKDGNSALHLAVRHGCEDVVVALAGARDADVNLAVPDSGYSALHLSVYFDRMEILQRLLETPGIDVNLAASSGATALAMCSEFGGRPVCEEAALRLLAHPDIDPNGAIFLLDSARVIDHLRARAHAPSTVSDKDFLVQELERWSCFMPSNGLPNRFLSNATNAKLGEVLYLRQGMQPPPGGARRDQHCKDAAFRLTLALEQALQFYGRYNKHARFCAQRLLVMAPRETAGAADQPLPHDHYHNQFVLGGIAYSRTEIEEMAQGRGRYALEFDINNIAQARWGANVHQEGFLLRGRDILERLVQLGGATVMTMEQAINAVEARITALVSNHAVDLEIDSILLVVNPSRAHPMPQEIKQQMADWAAAQPQPQRALLQDGWRARMMRLGLAQVLSQDGEVNEGGLSTTAPRTLHLMQAYITRQATLPDRQAVARQLQDAVLERLYDIGGEPQVCNTGCVQRLLDAAAGVDDNLMAREPHDRAIFDEILHIGSVVNQAFDVHCKEGDQAIVTGTDQRNYDELSGAVRKDILRATTIDDLIRRRGWSRSKVETQLNVVLDGL